jgi:hypothetical protein
MKLNTTNVLLFILGIILILCFVLMIMNNDIKNIENFDPVVDAIQAQLESESPEQLKSTIKTLQQRLIDYGYVPDLNNYVTKTQFDPNSGVCTVSTAQDRDKYMSKSDVPPPGPRIDLSQYVKKSSIPPEKVCPPPPEIDYSAYVKKSTLPPVDKCPPCIAPKVKVSAGLCRECPPAPSCPPPERCPDVVCPPQVPCPAQTCRPCDEIRYIKVPTLITKTIMVDNNGNVLSQQTTNTPATTQYQDNKPVTTQYTPVTTQYTPTTTQQTPSTTQHQSILNSLLNQANQVPTTTFPTMSFTEPNTTLAQTLDSTSALCPSADLNSEFKKYGIYGPP